MQLSISKTKAATIILMSLLMASAMAMWTVPVKAAEGPGTSGSPPAGVTYDTVIVVPHLSFRPTVVGKDQTFLVNMWTTPATHAARNHPNYTVVITKPDNSQVVVTLPSYKADATAYFEYIADQTGEWKLQFIFPGTFFPGGTLTGGFMGGSGTPVNPTYYKAASTEEQILTVQEGVVYSWPESPLPTDYWTRPVHVENREWWKISGNWPATGYNGHVADWDEMYPGCNPSWTYQSMGMSSRLIPWVEGPDSCHILWKRQDAMAGLIGGQAGQYGVSGEPGAPSVIYAGRVYDSYTKPGLGSSTTNSMMFRCYDLRTGQVYWEYPVATTSSGGFFFGGSSGLIPNQIEYNAPTQSEVSGAEAAGTWSVNLIRIAGSQLYKWNPWTGAMTANISISPISGGTFYKQPTGRGGLPLVLSIQSSGGKYFLINWTTSGTGTLASRIQSNTSYALSSLPSCSDFESGYGAAAASISLDTVYIGMNITGYNLWTGAKIWSVNNSEPTYSSLCDIADHGKFAVLSGFGYYVCYDMANGKKLWTSDSMAYPWSSAGFGGYTTYSAYGLIIREAYDGVYGINWTTGKIEWKYTSPAGSAYETPYIDDKGVTVMPYYSFGVGGQIADGKFFTWNYEHTESWPVTRGWSLHAIDCITGKGVWNLTGCSTPRAVADGYLVATGWADGYTYFIGKGKSATAVTAPDTEVVLGQSVVIKGSVMDLSPAQPNTPCVSVDSMKTQMDYLHMQLPIAGIWNNITMSGVQVYLSAVDPNNNYVDIGVATTNAYYGTFSFTWEPEIEGDYTIMASFAGDASYSSSGASTAITVGPAPTTAPTQEPLKIPDNTMLIYGLIIAVVVAIVIGLVNLLLVRKK